MARSCVISLCLLLFLTAWPSSVLAQSPSSASCPLNFTILNQFPELARSVNNGDKQCSTVESGLLAVISLYLRQTGFFLIPKGTSASCMNAYQVQLEAQGTGFNISTCPRSPFFSERGTDLCENIQTQEDFKSLVSASQLDNLNRSCSQILDSRDPSCSLCSVAIAPVTLSVIQDGGGNNASCTDFTKVYTVGVVSTPGPLDASTAVCMFYIPVGNDPKRRKTVVYVAVGVAGMLLLCAVAAGCFYYRHRHIIESKRAARRRRAKSMLQASSVPSSSINWFTIDVLNKATCNFSHRNILGTGGYGNVYKGTLPDGSIVALKRFKNCSPAGDKDFVHEVEMISSVRHRHLVAIRGCCVDSSGVQGHQRIIVYDYMPNGSLDDHLFPKKPGPVLDWPTRYKIAIGTARGLAYLHHDALPAIFHRDIKASNILLDTDFNARLADFGLAKFTREGVSHVTTKVAGTYGYMAPEYALFGQLTEKSDVYSFGIVLLELVTGRKVLSFSPENPHMLLSDWAWPLVQQGKWKSIMDPRMTEIGPDETMERFTLVAFLCAHPQVYCRPSVDQALRMLENPSVTVPNVPDRPLPFTSNQAEIEEALSREEGQHASRTRIGFSSYSLSSVSSRLTREGSSVSSLPSEATTLSPGRKEEEC